MRSRVPMPAIVSLVLALVAPAAAPVALAAGPVLVPQAVQAPDSALGPASGPAPACTTPAPAVHYTWLHCYTPSEIAAAYDVQALHDANVMGQGQTIVLVDAYGSPTAAHDLQMFHDAFFPNLPDPNFDQVFPQGNPQYMNTFKGNGLSGPSAAANWSGEATLDIEWAYSIAPLAHIVLLAVPPAETLGVQGFPNLFNAIQWAIDHYPHGTVFSQSFAVTEPTFGGAGATQTAKFDAVYKAGNAAGDTFLGAAGDNGTTGFEKNQKESRTYSYPTVEWPASSPYVTAVGGTQLQYGWTWDPTSDVPFTSSGFNPAYFNYTSGGNSQVVWNESWLPAATGGGPSTIYPTPSWQSSVSSVIGTNARGVPDVAWNAAVNGGVLVYITAYPNYQRAGWHIYGGTSAATPQIAGLIALANQERAAANKAPLGNVNPDLYALSSSDYWDVVPTIEGTAASGKLVNNTLWQYNADGSVSPGPVPGYPVETGWDMTTGFGSPKAAAFVSGLAAMP